MSLRHLGAILLFEKVAFYDPKQAGKGLMGNSALTICPELACVSRLKEKIYFNHFSVSVQSFANLI
jgi:hypothetical protein